MEAYTCMCFPFEEFLHTGQYATHTVGSELACSTSSFWTLIHNRFDFFKQLQDVI